MNSGFERTHRIYSDSIATKDFDGGIQALDTLIRDGIETQHALQFRSHLHFQAGNNAQAMRDLDNAIALGVKTGGLYYDRGVLHHHLGEHYLALRDFCEAVNLASAAGDDDLIDAAEHHFIEILDTMRSGQATRFLPTANPSLHSLILRCADRDHRR